MTVPLFRETEYAYSTGDRPYPTTRPLVSEMRVVPKDATVAPRGSALDLLTLTPGQRLTIRRDTLLSGAAPGDVVQTESVVVELDNDQVSVVDETVVMVEEPVATPEGEPAAEPAPAPAPQEPVADYTEPLPPVHEEPVPPAPPPPAPTDPYSVSCETQNYGYDDTGQPILVRVCHDSLGNSWTE